MSNNFKTGQCFKHVCACGRTKLMLNTTVPTVGEYEFALEHAQDTMEKLIASPPCTTIIQAKEALETLWAIAMVVISVQECLNGWDVRTYLPEAFVRLHAAQRQLSFTVTQFLPITEAKPVRVLFESAQQELLPGWLDITNGKRQVLNWSNYLLDTETWCVV